MEGFCRLLADATLALHLGFILFVVLGGVWVWRWPRLAWLHLPCVFWAGWIELTGGICPLTPLENRLLDMAGESGYPGDFIGHYLLAIIYPEGLDRTVQVWLGLAAIGLNLAIYGFGWRRRARCQR